MRRIKNNCFSATFVLISTMLLLVLSGCGGSSGGLESALENNSPVASSFNLAGIINQEISIDFSIQNADSDIDFSTLSIVESPEHGNITDGEEPGVLIYIPDTDFSGEDSFTYTAQDSNGNQANNAAVSIIISTEPTEEIPDEHPPATVNFSMSGTNDQSITIDFSLHISDEDGDVDYSTLTIITPPVNGTITDGASQEQKIYTPGIDFDGEDTFSFSVEDYQGNLSETATATLTIISNAATWGNVNWGEANWEE